MNALSTTALPQVRPSEHQSSSPNVPTTNAVHAIANQISQIPGIVSHDRASDGTSRPQTTMPLSSLSIPTLGQINSDIPGRHETCHLEIPPPGAEVLFDRYQRLMSAAFPFVVLPENVSVQALRKDKPVLLRAISTVALFHDRARQADFVKDVLRDIGERILVKNEKSMGILQGILVLVSWFHPHLIYTQQVTNLLHLGIALGTDMGIDRLPQQRQDFNTATSRAVHGPSYTTRSPTAACSAACLHPYSPSTTPRNLTAVTNIIRAKFGIPVTDNVDASSGSTASIQVLNQGQDSAYLVPVSIGTP